MPGEILAPPWRTKPPAKKTAMTLPGKHSERAITEHMEGVRGKTSACDSGVYEGREQKRNDREGENAVGGTCGGTQQCHNDNVTQNTG